REGPTGQGPRRAAASDPDGPEGSFRVRGQGEGRPQRRPEKEVRRRQAGWPPAGRPARRPTGRTPRQRQTRYVLEGGPGEARPNCRAEGKAGKVAERVRGEVCRAADQGAAGEIRGTEEAGRSSAPPP